MKDNTWKIAVLETIRDLGGEGCLEDIYIKIKKYVSITPELQKFWGNQPYYHHYVRSIIAKLKKSGELKHIDMGVYSIKDKGLERLEKFNKGVR